MIRLARDLGATRWSCQDYGEGMAVSPWATGHLADARRWHVGWAVIDFGTPDDLVLFLDAAAGGGERDGYYLRMVHWAVPGAWRVGACVRDLAADADGRGDPPAPARSAVTTGRVYLPRQDLAETAQRLDRWLDGYGPAAAQHRLGPRRPVTPRTAAETWSGREERARYCGLKRG